ncbi:MAG: hypothetical protein U0640_08125 [Phycisphaerales bacterium]
MKKSLCTKFGASLTLALALAAYAQPANDDCSAAAPITAGTISADNTGATADVTIGCGFNSNLSIWYSYTATVTGTATFATSGGTLTDTTLAAFDACGGTQIACDDDSGPGFYSVMSLSVTSGTTYYIYFAGYNGASGAADLTLTETTGGIPNDFCANAIPVTNGSTTAFDTIGALQDGPTCGTNNIWYSYTATGNEQVTLSLCGSSYDTEVSAYSGGCGALTQLVCNDDFCGLQSQASFVTGGAGTFLISVAGFGGQTGTGTMSLNAIPVVGPANDDCSGAISMFDGDNAWDNTFATQETTIGCAFGGAANSGKDVWYTYTATSTDNRTFEVTSYATGDSNLAIYDACGGTELACNDDAVGLLSRIRNFPTTLGTTYYIRLAGWGNPGGEGAGNLNISITPPPVPFDSCELAVAVAGQPVTQTYDTTGFTTDNTDCGGGLDGFYAWTPSASGFGVVSTCGLSGSDTTLAAYDSCGGILLACNDDFCGLQSTVSFPVTAGNTYIVRIAGFGNQAVFGDISFDVPPPPANDNCAGRTAAVVGSNAWNNVSATTEGPSGSCNFGGNPDGLDVWFDYTAGAESFISVDTFGSAVGDTSMQIFDTCGGTELACNDDAGGGLQSQICNFPVVTGTHYIIRVASWGAAPVGGDGVLNITASSGPTPFTPPAEAQDEPGTCDDPAAADLNGGCNVTPNAFTTLNVCDSFKGTGAAALPSSPGFRDTDWYEFVITTDDTYTFTGQTQFLAFTAILDGNCPPAIMATAFPDPACSGTADFSMSMFLTAGTYRYFMAPQFGAGNTCGTNDQYWFKLEGSTPCTTGPVCNDIDFNNDGSFFDPQDIDAFLSVYSEGPCIPDTATCDDIDFNNDTSIFDPCDIDSFLVVYSEGPCTPCGV